MKSAAIYVFCAICDNQLQHFGKITMNGAEREVYTLPYQNVAMVVCPIDGDVLPNKENLFAHQTILTKVMKSHSIIPMSFGNVFSSKEDVLLITGHLYGQFELLFPQLENKIEVGLKVIANQQWIDKEMEKEPALQKWKKEVNNKSEAAAFYDRIRLGEMAQKFVLSLQQKVENEIFLPLSELAEASKLNTPLTKKMLLNAAFLIDRKQEEEFDRKVNELYEEWNDKVEFKYSGPWPAYNFVNIRLRIEGES